MKIAVVDDFQKDRDKLALLIEGYLNEMEIPGEVYCYPDGEELLASFRGGEFSAIFLDIYMNGIDGMAVAERIRAIDKECHIIFVTSSENYGIQSYRVRAFYYLVKPYTKEELTVVFDEMWAGARNNLRYIEVKEERVYIKLFLHEIKKAELSGHYINIGTNENVVKTRMTMKEFLEKVHDRRFLECYRNIVINMDYVESIMADEFLMKDGERVMIQMSRLKSVKKEFADYMFDKARKYTGRKKQNGR